MKLGKININITLVLTVLIYIAVSDCFGLLDFSLIIPGELYDYIFVLILTLFLIYVFSNSKVVRFRAYNLVLWPYICLMLIAIVQMIYLQRQDIQAFGYSFTVVRELIFLWGMVIFVNCKYDERKNIKYLISLDIVSISIYLLEMIYGGPFLGNPLHSQGIYEHLGGFTLWRCWVDLPAFVFFTMPYLVMHIVKKESVFKTRKRDILAFVFILIGEIFKLGRTELIAVGMTIILAYYFTDRVSLYQFFKKAVQIVVLVSFVLLMVYIVLDGAVFERLFKGFLAIINISDQEYGSTLLVRTSAVSKRIDYLLEQSKVFFGMGPLHRNYPLIINAADRANSGVLCADNAYGTFILRYGFIGTGLYMFGNILNFVKLKKRRSYLCISVAIFLLAVLVHGFGGYEAMGKQTLLKVGLLMGFCIRESLRIKEEQILK